MFGFWPVYAGERFRATWSSCLNIDKTYFEGMVGRIHPPELQLNKANTSDTEAPFFGTSFASFVCVLPSLLILRVRYGM